MKDKIVWILIFVAFLPMMILRDFTPDNEARYLTIINEALRDGHFFSFTLNGEPYADKPPLYFWLMMLCRTVFGKYSMLSLSLLSFLPACGIVGIMNRWTKEEMSTEVKLTATLMLFTTAYFAGPAIVVRMDMLMCLFIVLALNSFWQIYNSTDQINHRQQWLMGLWLFLAVFSKGPLGLLIPVLAIVVFILINRQWNRFGALLNWRSIVVLALSCGLWFAMTYREAGGSYLYNLVFHQTVGRGVNSFHHARPFHYYLVSIWYEWLPWSLLCVGMLIISFTRIKLLTTLQQFFAVIVVTTLVLLSLISSKLQVYLLPAFPFVIYLTALLLQKFPNEKWGTWAIGIPQLLVGLAFPALFVARRMVETPLLLSGYVVATTAALSAFALISFYLLIFRKQQLLSIRSMAYGVLAAIFILGLGMTELNQFIV